MNNNKVLNDIKGGLIVSCQALRDEPLFSSEIMARMALAAYKGGAVGIRANTVCDIKEIKKTVPLPLIGIIKRVYSDSEIYITPTLKEIEELADSGCDICAIDATKRTRPNGAKLDDIINKAKKEFPHMLYMADIATAAEGVNAQELGFDIVSTTVSGYTDYTASIALPNIDLIEELSKKLEVPLIAEGGIWEVGHLKRVVECGAYAAVIGSAITRPFEITKRFVEAIR